MLTTFIIHNYINIGEHPSSHFTGLTLLQHKLNRVHEITMWGRKLPLTFKMSLLKSKRNGILMSCCVLMLEHGCVMTGIVKMC